MEGHCNSKDTNKEWDLHFVKNIATKIYEGQRVVLCEVKCLAFITMDTIFAGFLYCAPNIKTAFALSVLKYSARLMNDRFQERDASLLIAVS